MGDEFTWREALEILRVWEYTGRVRRGYFIEGLSGAQFIRKDDYEAVTALLQKSDEELIWLNASDPAQIWGKILKQPKEREFMILPGTAVALLGGLPAAVLEKQGKTLRVSGMTHKAGWISSCPDWYGISGKKSCSRTKNG